MINTSLQICSVWSLHFSAAGNTTQFMEMSRGAVMDWEIQEPHQSHFCGYLKLLLLRQQEDPHRSCSHVEKSMQKWMRSTI